MSISVRRVRKTRYQSTSWEHDKVPITRSTSTFQGLPPNAKERRKSLSGLRIFSQPSSADIQQNPLPAASDWYIGNAILPNSALLLEELIPAGEHASNSLRRSWAHADSLKARQAKMTGKSYAIADFDGLDSMVSGPKCSASTTVLRESQLAFCSSCDVLPSWVSASSARCSMCFLDVTPCLLLQHATLFSLACWSV